MTRKLTTRTSTAGSPSPSFKHQGILIEEGGNKFRIETLNGTPFVLSLNTRGKVSWSHMPPELRVSYAIAFCKHHNCGISGLPDRLLQAIKNNQEFQRLLDGLGIQKERTETLNGTKFTLPLDVQGRVSWISMTPDERIAYAIAHCKENNCRISGLPDSLRSIFLKHASEKKKVLEGLGIESEEQEVLNGIAFTVPLNTDKKVAWRNMTLDECVKYAIAYCKHHNCKLSKLPAGLFLLLKKSKEGRKQLLEGLGLKSEKHEVLNGNEFVLPLDIRETVSWKSMTPDQRVAYAIAYCLEHNCAVGRLPHALYKTIVSSEEELSRVTAGLDRATQKIEVIGEKTFILPLSGLRGVFWKGMTPDQRVDYAVTFCLHYKLGIQSLPNKLIEIIRSHPEEMKRLLEGIGRKSEDTQTVNGKVFTLPLNSCGTVSWVIIPLEVRVAYAIAYCLEHNCGVNKLPRGLCVSLAQEQKNYIKQELSKSKQSDQLADLANAMEEF